MFLSWKDRPVKVANWGFTFVYPKGRHHIHANHLGYKVLAVRNRCTRKQIFMRACFHVQLVNTLDVEGSIPRHEPFRITNRYPEDI
ncbi:hypothetical protein CEXT_354131 [Caerostris extrusa]|uniref:Uncharacterized protein n=1 Tax=Caerostris extrusa TaxID=172846 RepID=A0AAV4Y2Y2_CAEEX|nr:hypothetical protein CEXT_354131 [Caerostris extrusa]